MKSRRELFIIGSDAWAAVSPKEINATVTALKELGLYKLPYESVDIGIPYMDIVRIIGPDNKPLDNEEFDKGVPRVKKPYLDSALVLFEDIQIDKIDVPTSIEFADTDKKYFFKESKYDRLAELTIDISDKGREGNIVKDVLICLLATRNAVKTRVKDKLAALGIGKNKNRHVWTTTISLPNSMEDDAENRPVGNKKRPHLRRGHIRRQHYGPSTAEAPTGQFIKMIWIEPIFVNADETFVETRERYNLASTRRKHEDQAPN